MDNNNTPESGGLKGGLGSLFGGGTPEYSNTELAGVPCKLRDKCLSFNVSL